ncbi:MAG TPA: TetR/AcrR family transcriptional regulator [Xanthobacteraceae bacterium]|jgi:AcrR family transcriptional regulator|nr:TetR/AcrR family transcriptional regulator [Xanthobacteraceae bacterium]
MAKSVKAKGGGRLGRPRKDRAGDVEGRILDAAERVFLERGFQSASVDEIAARAPASKPTIYGHFAGKEALFAAVVARIIDGLTKLDRYTPEGRTVQDKLTSLGIEMVERTVAESVGVFRATIAEAQRFPDLSRRVHEAARNQGANAVSHLLNNATQTLSRAPSGPLGGKRSIATAQIFMDLILLPMLMRSLMGDEAKILRKELPSFMRERVGFFLAACEAGWKQ